MKNMSIVKFLTAVICISLLGTSCCTLERCNKKYPGFIKKDSSTVIDSNTSVIDSIRYITVYDTISADSSDMEIDINYLCDSIVRAKGFNMKSNGTKSHSSVELKNNVLSVKCKCDEQIRQYQIKDHFRQITKDLKIEKRVTTSEVKINPGKSPPSTLFKFFMYSGIVFWILVLIAIIYFTRNFWKKLFGRIFSFIKTFVFII